DIMKEHGECFEIADYTRRVSFVKSILGRAAEHRALNKVFMPEHWVDRLPDMLVLWSNILDGWKTSSMTVRDFDNAYLEAESKTYAKQFQALKLTSKADLLKPLNASGKPVLPLGLKSVWDDFASAQLALDQLGGDKLTIADLRVTTGEMGNSCLISAVKSGRFDRILDISRHGGGVIALDDFLSKDRHGNLLVNLLAEKNQLALAFSPDIWAGRVDDMKILWAQIKVENRQQVDFQRAEVLAKQATLKQKKGTVKILPRRPKQP
ncbi:MAG: hypothetical protein HY052_06980, partial [Proteobacteria bacterium]|nr:hypothetical protein [Pseudomonadota bacterium]